jgi:hypothetical protein
MFTRQDFRVGMKVYFGRSRGEQTLGEITRINPTKAKVKTLEARGRFKDHKVGMIWAVPYGMMCPAGDQSTPSTSVVVPPPPPTKRVMNLVYSPFSEDNLLLEALLGVYAGLSPENLTCDGEASQTHVNLRRSELERRKRGIFLALGYEVGEGQLYEWHRKRVEYQKEHKKQQDDLDI